MQKHGVYKQTPCSPALPILPHNAAITVRANTRCVTRQRRWQDESGVVSPLRSLDRDAHAALPQPSLYPQPWPDRRW